MFYASCFPIIFLGKYMLILFSSLYIYKRIYIAIFQNYPFLFRRICNKNNVYINIRIHLLKTDESQFYQCYPRAAAPLT